MSITDEIANTVRARIWPPNPRYVVCPDGTILDPEGLPVRGYAGKGGRRVVSIGGKPLLAAWVVCEAFQGPRPPGHQAAHEDGDPLNDAASNLSWKTPRENATDRFRHGTMRNKVTAADVVEIRRRRADGEELQRIAADYSVTKVTIWQIANRKTWRHI